MIWNNGPLRSEFPAAPGAGGGDPHPHADEELRFDEADFKPMALPREGQSEPAPASETPPAPAPAKQKKVFERRSTEGLKNFTRLVTRPETTYAASAAVTGVPSEASISVHGDSAPKYGRLKESGNIGYRPNRLHNVLNEIWVHSPLKWIDAGPIRQAVLLSLLLGALGGLGFLFWKLHSDSKTAEQAVADSRPGDAMPTQEEVLGRQQKIHESVGALLKAADWRSMLPNVYDPSGAAETNLRRYYEEWKLTTPAIDAWSVGIPEIVGGEWWFPVTMKETGGETMVIQVMEAPGGGRIDWQNFVAFGSMPWRQFMEEKPASATAMRVRVNESQRFSGKYQQTTFKAFSIRHRHGLEAITGYARTGTREEQALTRLTSVGTWHQVHLFLQFEPDANAPNTVLISGLRTDSWLDAQLLK